MLALKRHELQKLCDDLREVGIQFFTVAPGRRGAPDLVIVAEAPVAVWLRRADLARPLTVKQNAEIDKTAGAGWVTLIAFGAREALRELKHRGLLGRPGGLYAIA